MKSTDPWQSNKTKGAGEGREVLSQPLSQGLSSVLVRERERERERERNGKDWRQVA